MATKKSPHGRCAQLVPRCAFRVCRMTRCPVIEDYYNCKQSAVLGGVMNVLKPKNKSKLFLIFHTFFQ